MSLPQTFSDGANKKKKPEPELVVHIVRVASQSNNYPTTRLVARRSEMQMSGAHNLADAANGSSCFVLGGLLLCLVVLFLPAMTALMASCSPQSHTGFTCLSLVMHDKS